MSNYPFPELRAAYLRAIARTWRDPSYSQKLLLASEREQRGALDLLEADFHFKFPFDVKFTVDDKTGPTWRNGPGNGWIGCADVFRIHLPGRPEPVEDHAATLARYYSEFPTLLGRPRSPELLVAQAPDDFANFGGLTLRALALAWSDAHFATELFDVNDARGLIQDHLDTIVPWNFKLQFKKHTAPTSAEDEGYWKSFPRSEIVVYLPRHPKASGDVNVESVALAAYNDTGPQYPFTCG